MTSRLDQFFRLITRFAVLNLNWLAGIVVGLLVFGFIPATVTMFKISRRWIREDADFPLTKTFWTNYKKAFVKSNSYGLLVIFTGLILYMNYLVMMQPGAEMPLIVVVSYIALVMFYMIFSAVMIPVSIHFEGRPTVLVKKAVMYMFGKPHFALLLLLLTWGIAHVSLVVPTLILFFSGSVGSYLIMWLFIRSLDSLQNESRTDNAEQIRSKLSISNRRITT